MAGPINPVAVWREAEGTWSTGAHAFDLDFGVAPGPDGAPGVAFDPTAFRWACTGFATEAAARAGYGLHHPDPGTYAWMVAEQEDVGGLQAAMAACALSFRLDPAGAGLLKVPAGSRCTGCTAPGTAYEYHGRAYDGLTPYRGERLCARCRDLREATDGVDILVSPDWPWREPFIRNTVAGRDLISIDLPPELRGMDGRDLDRLAGRLPRRKSARSHVGQRRSQPAADGDAR